MQVSEDKIARRWAVSITAVFKILKRGAGIPTHQENVFAAWNQKTRQKSKPCASLAYTHNLRYPTTLQPKPCSWEAGRDVFDKYLIDADWSLNAANWMWLSASAFFR